MFVFAIHTINILYDLLSGTENLFNLDEDFLLVYSFLVCISFLEH